MYLRVCRVRTHEKNRLHYLPAGSQGAVYSYE